ncbi:RHS repeat-associated protein [Pseudomonas sp. TE12234]
MPSNRATVLCRYHYDPLDRLAASTPSAQASAQRFYLKDRLTTEIQGAVQRSIMQHEDQLLAQRERQTTAMHTHLLATDQQRSVLNLLDTVARHALVYTPYGHRHWQNALLSLLGFNGERRDPLTGWYFLGNGYRAFNTVLMRFNSPDSWSPFGKGGLNAYGYCVGDPVNRSDPTGHFGNPWKGFLNFLGLRTPRMARANTAYKKTTQTQQAPNKSTSTKSSSIYSNAGAESSSGLPSSGYGYASVQSYSSVDTSIAPSVPHRPPPGSSHSESHFSTQNINRLPTGRSRADLQSWVDTTIGVPNEQMTAVMQMPPTGYPTSAHEHNAIQFAGQRISRNIRANAETYAQGSFLIPLDDLRTEFFEKRMLQLRKK